MEEKEDVFRFEDFLKGSKLDNLMKMKQSLLEEGVFDEASDYDESQEQEYDAIDQNFNPYRMTESLYEDEEDEDESNESSNEDFYKLYKDKAEEFVCDIAVEGVSQSDTEVRLIVESEDWTLMFSGEIKNGKCVIPIKKLSLFNEGQTGNIRLEVNADGNLFTPWEDRFVVKMSKKVTVNMNESKQSTKPKPAKKGPGVKVSVKKQKKRASALFFRSVLLVSFLLSDSRSCDRVYLVLQLEPPVVREVYRSSLLSELVVEPLVRFHLSQVVFYYPKLRVDFLQIFEYYRYFFVF